MTTIIPANTSGKIIFEFDVSHIDVIAGEANFNLTAEGTIAEVPAGTYQFKLAKAL